MFFVGNMHNAARTFGLVVQVCIAGTAHNPVWLSHPANTPTAVDKVACTVINSFFQLTSSAERQLKLLMSNRKWQPAASDGADPTRFHPSRSQLSADLYEGRGAYEGVERYSNEELARLERLYPSQAQTSARAIQSRVLDALGGKPPMLVVEVGAFIGSGAKHVWADLARRKFYDGTDGSRLVLCVDTWQGALMMRLGSHRNIVHPKNGFPDIGTTFQRRMISEGLEDTVYPLPFYSIGGARLLYLLGYQIDVVYVDSAHELGETLIELFMFWQLLRPGGVLLGDDEYFEAVAHDRKVFAECYNVTWESFGHSQWMVRKPM